MIPRGTLLIIGGAENKGDTIELVHEIKSGDFKHFAILQFLRIGRKKIEIITTGSSYQHEVKMMYEQAFNNIGFNNIGFIHIEDRDEASLPSYIERIEDANAIFFSGGDQSKLSKILGETPLVEAISKRYYEDKNFLVAGTSAGAMVMSKIMIIQGGSHEAMLKNDTKTSPGFGLLEYCIIDTHFLNRCRFGRLTHAVISHPGQLGVGLGEDTALIIKNGEDAECLGSGMVVIIDNSEIKQINIEEVEDECNVFVENLKVHLLIKGCRFNLKSRALANPAISVNKVMDN